MLPWLTHLMQTRLLAKAFAHFDKAKKGYITREDIKVRGSWGKESR